MPGIKIITDSAADLPVEVIGANKIGVVPLDVRIDKAPDASRDLPAEEFWKVITSLDAVAETAAPSPGAFLDAFRNAREDGADGVVCVTLSSGLSATFQAACAGAAELDGTFPVEVVDSQSVTMGEGFLVLDAVEAARDESDPAQVAAIVRGRQEKVRVYGALDSLETLRRGGRIGSAQAFFGSLLAIKPIIEVRDGVVEGESRQRTRTRSLRYLADKVLSAGPLRRLAVAHAAADDLDVFLEMLAPATPEHELVVTYIGAVIGAHAGAGTVGVCAELA